MKIIHISISLLSVIGLSLIAIPAELQASISSPQWKQSFPNSEPQTGGSEGGGKGDGFCPIAPYQFSEVEQVWSKRPTLTWRGTITQIEIREQNSKTVVWSQEISAESQVNFNTKTESSMPLTLYQVTVGTTLKPGQIYELQVSTTPPIAYRPIQFRIMTPQEGSSMTPKLQTLEQKLAAENITGDAAKLQRADYFASQELWSEFWQEVLSVEAPSDDLKRLIHETVNQLCQ